MSDHLGQDDDLDHEEKESALKKKLFGGTFVLALISGVVLYLLNMPAWYQNYAPEQPIPFSHKLHAGQYQIPCLYCHGSAEYAAFAAVPGVETCMNCHSMVKTESPWMQQLKKALETNTPVAWVKVHVLPDFVYFNHSRHIQAGVQCQTCHGPVEEMERVYQYQRLTMGWCVECHRNDDYLTESRKEFSRLKKEMQGTDELPLALQTLSHPDPHNADLSCSTCHR